MLETQEQTTKQLIQEVEQVTERITETYPCDKCKVEFCSRLCYRMTRWAEIAKDKLTEYETAEEDGRLLTLPCKPGNVVYVIIPSYTTCSKYGYVFDEYSCIRCEEYEKECDSYLEYCIWENKYATLRWIIGRLERFGKTVFINREEAEKALKESEIGNETD